MRKMELSKINRCLNFLLLNTFPIVVLGVPLYFIHFYIDVRPIQMKTVLILFAISSAHHVFNKVIISGGRLNPSYTSGKKKITEGSFLWFPFFLAALFYFSIHDVAVETFFLLSLDFWLSFVWFLYVAWGVNFFINSVLNLFAERNQNVS